MHLNWVLVASKMQSLRHGFAKRTTFAIIDIKV